MREITANKNDMPFTANSKDSFTTHIYMNFNLTRPSPQTNMPSLLKPTPVLGMATRVKSCTFKQTHAGMYLCVFDSSMFRLYVHKVLIFYAVLPTTTPDEGEVRLVGGSGRHEGRVEIYLNGTWGTVCHEFWELQDAMVVCRQLGYGRAVGALGLAAFGEGRGPIWYSKLQCIGNEANLAQCAHSGLGVHYCDHSRDAGVICASE